MNQYRRSTGGLYEIPKPPSRPYGYVSGKESATREIFNKLDKVKKSTKEYAKPFIEHAKEYIIAAQAKGNKKHGWIDKTVGQPEPQR